MLYTTLYAMQVSKMPENIHLIQCMMEIPGHNEYFVVGKTIKGEPVAFRHKDNIWQEISINASANFALQLYQIKTPSGTYIWGKDPDVSRR